MSSSTVWFLSAVVELRIVLVWSITWFVVRWIWYVLFHMCLLLLDVYTNEIHRVVLPVVWPVGRSMERRNPRRIKLDPVLGHGRGYNGYGIMGFVNCTIYWNALTLLRVQKAVYFTRQSLFGHCYPSKILSYVHPYLNCTVSSISKADFPWCTDRKVKSKFLSIC